MAHRGWRKAKPFWYENMWKKHGEHMEFVNRSWDPGPGTSDLFVAANALSSLQHSLKTWDREVFGSVKEQARDLRAELEEVRSSTLYNGPMDREREIMAKLSDVLA